MVRRAEKKGIVVHEIPFDDALVAGIWDIYNEYPIRQGRPFPHFGKDLETVRKMSATFPDTSVFIGAFFEGKLIGFIKLTTDEGCSQAAIMHIVAKIQHRDKAPTNALVAEAVRTCANRGFPYLVYSKFAYGNKPRDSLSDFKENNGFRRIDVPRYYVPLTCSGSLCLSPRTPSQPLRSPSLAACKQAPRDPERLVQPQATIGHGNVLAQSTSPAFTLP